MEDRTKEIEAINRKRMKKARQEQWGCFVGAIGGILLIAAAATAKSLSSVVLGSVVLGVGSFLALASILLAAWIEWALR